MAETRLIVQIEGEECYFKQKEQEQIKALREKAAQENSAQYCEDHKYHCFRCGTNSLVEIQKGKIIVDVCVNDGCGAIHLDPGELEAILSDKEMVKGVRKSILDIFK